MSKKFFVSNSEVARLLSEAGFEFIGDKRPVCSYNHCGDTNCCPPCPGCRVKRAVFAHPFLPSKRASKLCLYRRCAGQCIKAVLEASFNPKFSID